MPLSIERGFKSLVAAAEARVEALSPTQLREKMGQSGVLLVDLRDIRELQREGRIPGSLHIPRGMLEFWVDPASPYYRREFDTAEELVLYCNKGWRSALAASSLLDMGVTQVSHLAGGMERWQEQDGAVEALPSRKPSDN